MTPFIMYPAVLTQMRDLPPAQSERLGEVLERIANNPAHHGFPVKKLKDRNDVFRFRLGDWRVFYTFGSLLEVLAIRRRTDTTYSTSRFLPSGEHLDVMLSHLDPADLADDDEDLERHVGGEVPADPTEPLKQRLTPELLSHWRIPAAYHPVLAACETVEDLLGLTIDQAVVSTVVELLYPSSLEATAKTAQYLVHDAAELVAYAQGRLSELLLKLDAEQLAMVDHRLEGPAMVRGGPGTGKTVIALYRVRELARRRPNARILFATYTRTLVRYAEELLRHLLAREGLEVDLTVETVDKLVRQHVGSAAGKIADQREASAVLSDLLQVETSNTLRDLGARYLFEEFENVIEAWGIGDLPTYQNAPRTGRRVPLYAEERALVWRLYTAWRAKLKAARLMTWNQLRGEALRRANPAYDAVFVDEAQDLPPVALRFLVRLARDPKGLYLTADANQSIYQTSFSWRMVHEALDMRGKSSILRRDYRTTRTINAAVRSVAEALGLELDGFPEPGLREGPKPRTLALNNEDGFDQLARAITGSCMQAKLPLGTVAVLAPWNSQVDALVQELNLRSIDAIHAKDADAEFDHPAVKVLTLKSVKGLEFPIVFVTHMDEGVLPATVRDIPDEEVPTYHLRDAKEFFVACSRAMRDLVVAYRAESPSTFVQALEPGSWEVSS